MEATAASGWWAAVADPLRLLDRCRGIWRSGGREEPRQPHARAGRASNSPREQVAHDGFDSGHFSAVRSAFPITARRAYLFAGGIAPLSTPSRAALEEYAALSASDPVATYRDYPLAEAALLRETVPGFLNAPPADLAIVDSTSRANNLAVQMIEAPPGSNVVVDSTTYPSALLPWLLRAKVQVEVRRVEREEGVLLLDSFRRLVDDLTVALSVSHVCRSTGFRHDLRALARLARARDAVLLVDAAQSVGVVPIDVKRDGVDVLTFGAMKW